MHPASDDAYHQIVNKIKTGNKALKESELEVVLNYHFMNITIILFTLAAALATIVSVLRQNSNDRKKLLTRKPGGYLLAGRERKKHREEEC